MAVARPPNSAEARALLMRQDGPPFHRLPLPYTGGEWRRAHGIELSQKPAKILDADPNRYGAFLFNNGGKYELPIDLGAGDRTQAALPLAAFIDSGSVRVPQGGSTYKSIAIVVDTALTWVGAGQSKIALLVGYDQWGPASGASSKAGGQNAVKGAAANFGGAAATSIATGLYPFSPVDMADLQWTWPYVGVELQIFAALTAGAARAYLELAFGPDVFVGTDRNITAKTGDTASSIVLPSRGPWQFVQSDREVWAMAAPGGIADLRVWEVLYSPIVGVEAY